MKYFLSFMGYPRSGHTLVAAILNANPNCVVSNQLNIYSSNSVDLNNIISYSTNPSTWKDTTQIVHVPKQEITVIGDKTGHRTVEILRDDPQRLGMLKSTMKVPFKWIHVVRNPYDNLATWGMLNYQNKSKNGKNVSIKQELNEVIEKYSLLNQTIDKLRKSEDVLTVNHEYVITRMHNTLEEIANFLEISFDPAWRDNVRSTVWKKPRITRNKIKWTPPQKKAVDNIIKQYPWLNGYVYGGCGGCRK
jgi:hypothetical protein